jgi:hypothetical protein
MIRLRPAHALAFCLLLGCSSTTTVVTQPPPNPSDAATPGAEPAGEELPDPQPGTDAGLGDAARDAGRGADGAAPRPDAAAPDAGPTISGGKLTLFCPPSGFHQRPPIEISSLPPATLPRCSAATKTCVAGATTSQAYDACLRADQTPPAVVNGEPIDCLACDRTQGSYCLAWACQSEFSAYACCAQDKGEEACASLLQAVTSCAATTRKASFDACVDSLVGACFP